MKINFNIQKIEKKFDIISDIKINKVSSIIHPKNKSLIYILKINQTFISHLSKIKDAVILIEKDLVLSNKILNNNIIIKSTIYATISNTRCSINVSWNNCHNERTIHIYDSNQRLLIDFIKKKIVISNKIEQEFNLIDKEEPLFNSISWFINSTLQNDDTFYKNHMNVNIQIMYIIQQILKFNK